MLTNKEKRFITYWEDQRKGGKWKYYLLYILAGTFIATLILTFLSAILLIGFPEEIWKVPIAAFVIVTAMTIFGWHNNEKKFKTIIRREIKEGEAQEERSI